MRKLSEKWLANYNQMVEFKNRHGNTNVPRGQGEYESLGHWVKNQRYDYRKGNMDARKIDMLEDLGFSWDQHEEKWQTRSKELQNYIDTYGDAQVPQRHPRYRDLAIWVSTQRTNLKRGKLSRERYKTLDNMGFVWETSRGRKKAAPEGGPKEVTSYLY